jgi:hypothetical protein
MKIWRRSLDGRRHSTRHRSRHPRRLSCPVVPRGSYYRDRRSGPSRIRTAPRPSSVRALAAEREAILAYLHHERFQDRSPAAVYATLLDEERYHCSIRTMYRLLAAQGESRERRDHLTHPPSIASPSSWPRLPINFGVGTSPNF